MGAIDVVAIRRDEGDIACGPFHVRMNKGAKRGDKRVIHLKVNKQDPQLFMKLGGAGEAFFIERTKEKVLRPYRTSPIASPVHSPIDTAQSDNIVNDLPPLALPSNISLPDKTVETQSSEVVEMREGASPSMTSSKHLIQQTHQLKREQTPSILFMRILVVCVLFQTCLSFLHLRPPQTMTTAFIRAFLKEKHQTGQFHRHGRGLGAKFLSKRRQSRQLIC